MIFVIALVALLVVLVGVFFAFKKMTHQPEQPERRSSTDYESAPASALRDKVADGLDMPPPPTATDAVAPASPTLDDGFDDVQIAKTFELGDDAFGGAEVSTVSEAEVDDLTEYKVYKQFGYYDKAAKSLNGYLSLLEEKPKELVFELCGMYLEIGDVDTFVQALRDYEDTFERPELEEVTKMAFELEPNNLDLRVFAEEKLGWDVDLVARSIVKEDRIVEPTQQAEETQLTDDLDEFTATQQTRQKTEKATYFSKLESGKQLVKGFSGVSNITPDERETVIAFSSREKAARLLGKEIDYVSSVNLYNKAISDAKRPASIAIDALNSDFKNQNINNYAEHLWNLYSVLGRYGRLVKEKMLGWGSSLGQHPLFDELEDAPNEVAIKELGVKYGYVGESASAVKSRMQALVVEDRKQEMRQATNEIEAIIQEADSLLEYGEIDGAIKTLEDGVFAHRQEAQLYTLLLDLYERSENWKRFEDFSIKVRSDNVDLPEDVVVALSNLTQRMNEGRVK
ncbi:MAG: 23S rRNA methyltransferase [Neisseriaceae bacterium]|nr:23S rRNA methyltransferase [Neisseriaceae bacterium]